MRGNGPCVVIGVESDNHTVFGQIVFMQLHQLHQPYSGQTVLWVWRAHRTPSLKVNLGALIGFCEPTNTHFDGVWRGLCPSTKIHLARPHRFTVLRKPMRIWWTTSRGPFPGEHPVYEYNASQFSDNMVIGLGWPVWNLKCGNPNRTFKKFGKIRVFVKFPWKWVH